ncbi:hypothetical protein [Rickettsiales endosymbiont of Stachyamoeba lipophora]|uniref:hypothetical protein n=1 Tax=Rickettsiales endosymbiont of Stachyamoeba lipophora TaxID=2486578 RepID=UPI000F652F7D|nr:hypothetical protein [Rickettsiales endosymbiont of Stachyamoeba lipophora]AZL15266.1 hypothetical protein EF513_01675 [Rickettsiales endosymbiont of Stachyamoeba lipophora]
MINPGINPINDDGSFSRIDKLDYIFYKLKILEHLQTQILSGKYNQTGLLKHGLVQDKVSRDFAYAHAVIVAYFKLKP